MNGALNILFNPQTACLTKEAMFDYIDGKLTPAQCHAVERHLLDCAFCSEAMEGLELVKDRSKVSAFTLPAENTDSGSGKQGRIIRLNFNARLAIAAIMILLIGSFVFMRYFLPDHNLPVTAQSKQIIDEKKVNESNAETSEDQTFSRNFEPFPAQDSEAKAEFTPPSPKEEDRVVSSLSQTSNEQNEVNSISIVPPAAPMTSKESPSAGAPGGKADDAGPYRALEKGKDKEKNNETTKKSGDKQSQGVLADDIAPSAESASDKKSEQKEVLTKQREVNAKPMYNANTVRADSLSAYHVAPAPAAYGQTGKDEDADHYITDQRDANKAANSAAPAQKARKSQADNSGGYELREKDYAAKKVAPAKDTANGYFKFTDQTIANTDSTRKTYQKNKIVSGTGTSVQPTTPVTSGNYEWTTTATKQTVVPAVKSPANTSQSYSVGGSYATTLTLSNANGATKSNTLFDEAMAAYRQKDFITAIQKLNTVIAAEPANNSALFYAGVSQLSLPTPDTKQAISCFDKVLLSSDNSFAEAARWYKALALIKDKKEEDAKVLLQEMSKKQGAYKAKADKVLKDIEEEKKK